MGFLDARSFWRMKIGVVMLNSVYVISVRVIWSTWTVIGRHDMT